MRATCNRPKHIMFISFKRHRNGKVTAYAVSTDIFDARLDWGRCGGPFCCLGGGVALLQAALYAATHKQHRGRAVVCGTAEIGKRIV